MNRPAVLLSLVLGLPLAAAAEDWPEFRGPTGQGHYAGKGLPTAWGPTQNVAWKQPSPGRGWSSPVVQAGRVYLTTAVPARDGKGHSLRALALDAASGKILWDTEVFPPDDKAPPIHSKNSHASPTPVVDAERVYAHFGHHGTAALDRAGKVLWRQSDLHYTPVHGNGGSPIPVDDRLVFAIDGADKQRTVALDRATGRVAWSADRQAAATRKFSFGTPLLVEGDGRRELVSPGSNAVMAYDPAVGRELWRVTYDGYSLIPRPVHGHGLVFVCTGYDRPSLLAIRPGGAGDVTKTHVAWRTAKGVPNTPSLLLAGDELYMVSDQGVASCLDARTGKAHWSERLGGAFSASPLYADGKIYFQSEDGVTTVVRAGREFEQVAVNRLNERTFASPAAADGALYLRTEGHLYRLQAK
jgi:outer membrane protein assembly factor BamB